MSQSTALAVRPVNAKPVTGPTVSTITGNEMNLMWPRPESVDIEDIAHSLSRIPRWNGHTSQYYSVAQHSVFVSEWVCTLSDMPESPKLSLAGLLHDAAEAYMGDITTPVKRVYPQVLGLERQLLHAICERFGLPWPMPPEVKAADLVAMATEADQLRGGAGLDEIDAPPLTVNIIALPAEHAKRLFLGRYYELVEAIK